MGRTWLMATINNSVGIKLFCSKVSGYDASLLKIENNIKFLLTNIKYNGKE